MAATIAVVWYTFLLVLDRHVRQRMVRRRFHGCRHGQKDDAIRPNHYTSAPFGVRAHVWQIPKGDLFNLMKEWRGTGWGSTTAACEAMHRIDRCVIDRPIPRGTR